MMDIFIKVCIEILVVFSLIFVFMKGFKLMFQCGFLNNVVQILYFFGVVFEIFDVFFDLEICQGIKEFFSWFIIFQVYVKGDFIGGFDILIEMYNFGEFCEKLEIVFVS